MDFETNPVERMSTALRGFLKINQNYTRFITIKMASKIEKRPQGPFTFSNCERHKLPVFEWLLSHFSDVANNIDSVKLQSPCGSRSLEKFCFILLNQYIPANLSDNKSVPLWLGLGYPLGKDLGPESSEKTWNWGTPRKGSGTRDQ